MRLALALAAFALGVRVLAWTGSCTIGSDSFIFLDMARLIGAGEWSSAMRWAAHPAYPAMTAGLGGSAFAGTLISVVLGAAGIIPLFLLVAEAIGEAEARVAALLYAVLPALVEVTADVMTDGVFVAFFVTAIWAGWKALDRWSWAPLAGLMSGLAYLTRPEGLLLMAMIPAWLVVEAVRRRTWRPLAGGAIVVAVSVVVAIPYLLWLHRELQRWTVSLKGGARAVTGGAVQTSHGSLYVDYLKSTWRVAFGVLVPFTLWGMARTNSRGRWYIASFGLAWFAAMLYAMPYVGYIGSRYLLAGFVALLGATAIGWIEMTSKLRPAVVRAALLLLVVGLMGVAVRPRRWGELALVDAGAWIAQQKPRAKLVATSDKIAYYAGGELVYRRFWEAFPPTFEEFESGVTTADFIVTTSRDSVPAYLARLGELRAFERVPDDFVRGRGRQDAITIYRRR